MSKLMDDPKAGVNLWIQCPYCAEELEIALEAFVPPSEISHSVIVITIELVRRVILREHLRQFHPGEKK